MADARSILRYIHGKLLPILIPAATFGGMLFSRSLLSSGMIAICVYALVLHHPGKIFRSFVRDPALLALTAIFFIYLLSGFNSENLDYWKDKLWMRLPFLFLPLCSSVFKNQYNERQLYSLLFIFIILVSITSAYFLVHFYESYDRMQGAYHEGRTMTTSFSHVRYSLMVAIASIVGIFLLQKKFYIKWKWEKWIMGIAVLFLIYFLHVLAVRSGLVAFYLSVFYLLFYYVLRTKKFITAMGIFVLIVCVPITAYFTLPTVKAKINYMKYDLSQYFVSKNASGLSDAGRIISIRTAAEIIKEHPVFGVGIGDLKDEMERKLRQAPEHPKISLMPHNEFIYVGAATGLVGLIAFMIMLLIPIFYFGNYKNPLMFAIQLIVLSSFLTEATIEEQLGTAIYLVFILLLHAYLNPVVKDSGKTSSQEYFGRDFIKKYFAQRVDH